MHIERRRRGIFSADHIMSRLRRSMGWAMSLGYHHGTPSGLKMRNISYVIADLIGFENLSGH